MTDLRLGLVIAELSALERVRPDDGVDLVVLRNTLLDMPRASAARRIAERVRERAPAAEIVPYAWHFVTHAVDDPLPGRGSRGLDGDPGRAGHLGATPEVEQAWEATLRAAAAFGAGHIVLRTPPAFAPGTRGRNRLRTFAQAHAGGPSLVWEPEGLWEPEEVCALSAHLSLTPMLPLSLDESVDPMDRWIVQGVGGSPAELRGGAAEDLVDDLVAAEADAATVLFAGAAALKNLRRVRRLWPE